MSTHKLHRPTLSRLRARLRSEDGWAGQVFGILGIGILVFAGLQTMFWAIGSGTAQAAADFGYSTARAYQSTDQAGEATAQQLIAQIRGSLRDPQVTVSRTAETVTVTVTGRVPMLLPGLELPPVTRTQTGPIERWVPAP